MKEQHCSVSTSYEKSMLEENYPENSIRLPDGNRSCLGQRGIAGPEIMFQPGLALKKSWSHELIYYSLP